MSLIGFLGIQWDFQRSVLWTGGLGAWLSQEVATTLRLSVLAWLIACALRILAGALRTVPFAPLRPLATFYVEFFRNVPLLVWMFFWYFGVPQMLPRAGQDWLNLHGPEFWSAVAGLSVYHGARMSHRAWIYYPAVAYIELFRGVPLVMVIFWFWFLIPQLTGQRFPDYTVALTAFVVFEAAYLAEIVRAGIQSVPRGQNEAATTSGLAYGQRMVHVILAAR